MVTKTTSPKLAVYIEGDLYSSASTSETVVQAGITTPIPALFHINVSQKLMPGNPSPKDSHDGDITFNNQLILRDGEYAGDEAFIDHMKNLRAGDVSDIYVSFGGWQVPDFSRGAAVIRHYQDKADNPLYENLKMLKELFQVDGFDFDYEEAVYNPADVLLIGQMLLELDYKITFCPYTRQDFWQDCIEGLGSDNIEWLNLQCYDGGGSNDPHDWTHLGVPIVAGLWAGEGHDSPEQIQQKYARWQDVLSGGFLWRYSSIEQSSYTLADYVDSMRDVLG